ncbi:MAG: response regulator [Desulfobulbaceae bacterium]|nr:response regulator [Desulfobulbaceae bacterium]
MKNILIVDDEETVRVTLSEWFSATYGPKEYHILQAANGISAIKHLATTSIDLLITDLNMPKMDGFELLAQMKSDYPRIPIIVISAFSTPDIKTKVVDLGAIRFIPKPFSFSDLEAINVPKLLEPTRKADKGFINGISLQSFLQLISMEAKSCTLTVRAGGKSGEIFLERGELMDARTGDLEGNDAAFEIISWSDDGLTIEIDKVCHTQERKIEFPIMHLLMEAARMADERSIQEASSREASGKDDDDDEDWGGTETTMILKAAQFQAALAEEALPVIPEPEPPPLKPPTPPSPPQPAVAEAPRQGQINLSRQNLMKIQERCKEFSALDGFAGAVLLTVNGDILQVVGSEGSSINLERASVYANSILSTVQTHAKNMGMGVTSLIQVDTTGGHLIIAGRSRINLMLVLITSSSLGLAKVMISSAIDEICAEINC